MLLQRCFILATQKNQLFKAGQSLQAEPLGEGCEASCWCEVRRLTSVTSRDMLRRLAKLPKPLRSRERPFVSSFALLLLWKCRPVLLKPTALHHPRCRINITHNNYKNTLYAYASIPATWFYCETATYYIYIYYIRYTDNEPT